MVSTPRASNPGSTSRTCQSACRNSPTVTSSTVATATSPATNRPRRRSVPRVPNTRVPWRSSPPGGMRAMRHAGTRPMPRPVASVAAAATASTLRSAPGASAIGRVVGTRAAATGMIATASPAPAMPPTADNARLSVSTWRARRLGRAPIARRIASSRCRETPRASSRLARFAQAMSSTALEAPTSACSIVRDCRVTSSRRPITVAPVRSLAGNVRASSAATVPRSARACATVTPGARRATACR